jgi:hypothetical protein
LQMGRWGGVCDLWQRHLQGVPFVVDRYFQVSRFQ